MSDTCDVFVTGAAGVLGSQIVKALRSRDLNVVGSGRVDSSDVDAVWDLRESPRPSIDIRPRIIVHAAARTTSLNVDLAYAELMDVNVGGTERVANWGIENSVERFVLISGALVYGGWQTSPRTEAGGVDLNSGGAYGESKYRSEQELVRVGLNSGMEISILRLSSLYGAGYTSGLPQRLILEGMRAGTIVLSPPTSSAFDLLHVQDAAASVVGAIDHASGGVWNIGSGNPTSIVDLANICAEAADASVEVKSEPVSEISGKTPKVMNWVDDSLARQKIGHVNSIQLEAGIESIRLSLAD